MSLLYPDIQMERTKKGPQYTYAHGALRKRLHPGVVCNNVTQATARIVMTDGLLRISARYPVKGTVHDEGIMLVPDTELEEGKKWIKEMMIQEPVWMPGIPLNADVGAAKRYGEAKG